MSAPPNRRRPTPFPAPTVASALALEGFTRRDALRAFGVGLAVVPLTQLFAGCDSSDPAAPTDAATSGDAATRPDAATTPDASGVTDGGPVTGWATGGTAAMLARDSYPNPFAGSSGSSCSVTCAATIGPCHTASPERADVSDAWDGLPVRLALRVVDATCAPISNAIVEIWHTNPIGVYSGRIAPICNTEEEDRAAQYFRGYLRTDTDGRVDFDTCFPGWYRGRAIHIHFRIMTGDYDGSDSAAAEVVSQLFFSDELVSQIFTSEPNYRDLGQPDTSNATDSVLGGADPTPYVCDVARMSDGAMQASKTIVVRGTSCRIAT